MTKKALFLKGPEFSVIDEVLHLMETENSCHDLPAYIATVAGKLPEITGLHLREFRGPSGAIYPAYITVDEPYIVYAVLNRDAEPQIQVLKVGLRNDESAATFFPSVGAEVERRVAVQGWSL
jgi:hypothetical protein